MRHKKYWDETHETMPETGMRSLQTEKLRIQVRRAYDAIPFYQSSYATAGVKPSDLGTTEDLRRFPFTTKQDLAAHYPFGFLAVPPADLVRIHASSGTTGRPSPGFYTAEDVNRWTECMARGLWAQEVRPDGVFQNANGMGLFTGGLGFHQAAQRIGCAVVPTGTGMTERQIMLILDFGVTALTCTASYCLTLIERAEKMGVDLSASRLRTGHFGAEPWSEEMRREMERRGGFRAYEHYGLTELMGPGVAFSCEHRHLHINEDHVFPEIIDPVTLKNLDPGERGELVLTSLQREAMPLIRYRTRDLCRLRPEPCECGRSLVMMDKVTGRTDDMIIVSGVNVFPSQIESVLMDFEGVEPVYRIRLTKEGPRTMMTVETELKSSFQSATEETVRAVSREISTRVKAVIGITVGVVVVPPGTIPRSEGKAKRVWDERQ